MSDAPAPAPSKPTRRVPRSIYGAAFITLAGAALWIYAATTATPPGTMPQGVSSLSNETIAEQSRLIDDAAPAITRLGISFIVGFLIAWVFRKFVMGALLAGALIGVLFYLAQRFGIAQIDWDAARQHVDESLAWAKGQAEAARTFLLGYLPSGASGAVGMFMGARKR
ncbi:MAG: FUN14 domain-containing protein [Phycisphaerales bacterium]|nr:FUN14 domain-containing protein [Phycisphaerales bacterium]